MSIPIDQLAAELGLTRIELDRAFRDLRVRGSAWRPVHVTDELANALRVKLPEIQARWERQRQARAERAAQILTTGQAAVELRISPDRIRQWAARGYLQPAGRSGRSTLYRLGDVEDVHRQVRARSKRTVHYATESPADLEKLVPTAIAAKIAQVTPSTIRGWVQRGHLQPVGRHRRRLVFTVRDVVAAANRHR